MIIKIDTIKNTATSKPSAKPRSVSGYSFEDFLSSTDEIKTSGPVDIMPASFNPLLSLQEISEDDLKKKAKAHGKKTLEILENLHQQLILGEMSLESIQSLKNQISSYKTTKEPLLAQLINEIEARAEVELAKRENLL